MAWIVAIPVIISFSRLREGWRERLILKERRGFDLWIHGASVGEALMAADIISDVNISDMNILATTNTAQGKEILKNKIRNENVIIRYFPFDIPSIMKKAFSRWRPKLAVLLETELWPSFIYECKKRNIPLIIINGRLSKNSLKSYMRFKPFWKRFSPDMVFAVSEEDAERYGCLFGKEKVTLMNNIKFDHINTELYQTPYELKRLIPDESPFLIFGSVRKEEERDILLAIEAILAILPNLVIGLFPRHMKRLDWWKEAFEKKGIKWMLRSEVKATASSGTVIIWDRFGELKNAYSMANAVFVGGSLKPCGGHNFLEPLTYGLIPCVGPFLHNFQWVDKQLFEMGLVTIVKNWKELTEKLIYQILIPFDKSKVKRKFESFIRGHKGGKEQALEIILKYLNLKDGVEKR